MAELVMRKGCAISPAFSSPADNRRSTIARRVGLARAENTASSSLVAIVMALTILVDEDVN